jgi:hypothetical protein
VLSDVIYPGWQVSVDGRPAELASAEGGVLRAVEIGPGAHEIVFAFRPARVYLGGTLTAVGLAALAVTIWRGRRRGQWLGTASAYP